MNQHTNEPATSHTQPSGDAQTRRCKCPCATAARLTNGLYFLGLGTWFGAIVMLAISAAATFQTVRAFEPTLHVAPWNQPELASRAPSVLAGAIVGSSLNGLRVVQIICATIVILTLIAQHTLFRNYLSCTRFSKRNITRLLLIAVPVIVLLLNIFWITPNVLTHRDAMWDMTTSQAQRQQAQASFDRFHKLSERSVGMAAMALAGSVLISSLVLGSSKKEVMIVS